MQRVLTECASHPIDLGDNMTLSSGAGWKSCLPSFKGPEVQVADSAVNAPPAFEDLNANKDDCTSEAEFNGLGGAEC